MNTTEKILVIVVIALIAFAIVIANTARLEYKPPLDSCDHLTNETYDNYPNSNVCKFNGTGWEPMFGNDAVKFAWSK